MPSPVPKVGRVVVRTNVDRLEVENGIPVIQIEGILLPVLAVLAHMEDPVAACLRCRHPEPCRNRAVVITAEFREICIPDVEFLTVEPGSFYGVLPSVFQCQAGRVPRRNIVNENGFGILYVGAKKGTGLISLFGYPDRVNNPGVGLLNIVNKRINACGHHAENGEVHKHFNKGKA